MNQKHSRQSFTLIELLLVIGVIAILSSIVIIAVNPTAQLAKARDSKRAHNVEELQKAVTQYQIANGSFPPVVGSSAAWPTGFGNSLPICKKTVTTDATCVSLDAVAPTYIAELPQDDSETNANYTGYKITKKDDRPLVTSTYMAGSVLTTDMILYWPLDEKSGTSVVDASGNGLTGTISNPAGVVPASAVPKTTFPNAGSFFISSGNVSVANDSAFGALTDKFTATAWLTTTSITNNPIFVTKYGTFYIYMPNGQLNTYIWSPYKDFTTSSSPAPFLQNTWAHAAVTYDGATMKLYVNGKLEGSTPVTAGNLSTYQGSSYPFLIGTYYGGSYQLNGYMDDVRLYKRALSAAEIAMIAAGTN